ncbi:hypothetical protein [Sporosarcina sp. NPDC096371]|uniref:hypothetical protein n=1 Tax=Sporosarcina sp. NPDC096371 TaxID=3364530 RepID=UPI0038143AC3
MANVSIDIIAIIAGILAWGVIGMLAYRTYKKLPMKPKVWKVIVVLVVGLVSLSFNWNLENGLARIPILPLGVWLLYWVLKRKEGRWERYRAFAWLGFLANFIMLATTLLAVPVHHAIYPADKPSTYLAGMDNAAIIQTHPSAKDRTLNKESIQRQLPILKQETIYSDQWYSETYMDTESTKKKERFPYQLIGTTAKWGSGIETIVFIEEDGRGILLTTPKQQLYFLAADSVLGGGE